MLLTNKRRKKFAETYLDEEESKIFFEKWKGEGIHITKMFAEGEADYRRRNNL